MAMMMSPLCKHTQAYRCVWGFIWNKTGNIAMSNLDVCCEKKHHPIKCLKIANKVELYVFLDKIIIIS